ncbi:MAG: hypothetical protein ACK5N8_09080 [Alphaproteobacteria bacterium]
MKKILTAMSLLLVPTVANAGEPIKKGDFTFKYSGLAGAYYGVMETKNQNNLDNMSNRWVQRTDGSVSGEYAIDEETKAMLFANYTLAFSEHNTAYRNGDWRFYPHAELDSKKFGTVKAGYTYNVAVTAHQGAKDITFLGIGDSNIIYFLTNPNWNNGKHAVAFTTPKSTALMDDGRALKFSYITPKFANTQLGFSYTPDNPNRRGMVSRYAHYEKKEDAYVFAMNNEWETGFGKILTSAGYGVFNRTDKSMSVGAGFEKGNFNVRTAYKKSYIDGKKDPITTVKIDNELPAYFDNYREGEAWDMSVGYKFNDSFKSNLAYLYSSATNTRHNNQIYILSNVYTYNKYIDLYLIGAHIDAKGLKKDSTANNKGYAGIVGIGLKF